jgi:putative DNA primase/helicase
LRSDGTLLTDVGYDPTSRLFLTQDVVGLRVNTKLSAKEAKNTMTQLLAPFSEYPWADKANRAVFVAALFTVGLRHLFETAPLFAFSSPKHGSGKTQLAECISRLWYGITLSKATWTPNPEEMEKRIASFLLAGDRMVCLDNVTEGVRLEDSTLNKVLTSRRNTFRILGRTERVELSNEATWFATGNQLMLSGDISRRALLCYIDAKVVDPGARSFTIQNLPAHIMRNRPVLMSAALSIAASWMALGRPNATNAPREFGSFNDWYSVIRPMILWAGEADIAQNIDNLTDEDTENVTLESFANALRTSFPPDSSRLPLAEVLKLFSKDTSLRSAFAGCMPSDREPNFRTLSELLRRCENKIFISDNPGHEFTVNKRKDSNRNIFLWGVEYLKK